MSGVYIVEFSHFDIDVHLYSQFLHQQNKTLFILFIEGLNFLHFAGKVPNFRRRDCVQVKTCIRFVKCIKQRRSAPSPNIVNIIYMEVRIGELYYIVYRSWGLEAGDAAQP